jgi:tetratricopeptide (TPR) repeat protein
VPRYWPAAVLCLGLSLIALAKDTEPTWNQVHAQHFVVFTDHDDKRGKEVALRFEQMRALTASLLMKERLNMPTPITILALRDNQQYLRTAPVVNGHPTTSPGFLIHQEDQVLIVVDTSEPEPWSGVAADYARLALNYNYPPTPAFFDEGFVAYFASVRLGDRKVETGSDPGTVLNSPKSFTELLNGTWMPVAQVLAVPVGASDKVKDWQFRAESWMVMHYILNKGLLPQTGSYFDLTQNQKVPVDQAIEKAYGMTAAQFEEAIKTYFHSLPELFAESAKQQGSQNGKAYIVAAPVGPEDFAATITEVPAADMHALIGDVMARLPEHRDQAIHELQALTEGTVDNAAAHRALAWAYIQKNDFQPAAEELGKSLEIDQKNPMARYYLAFLKYRLAQTTGQEIQGLGNMMQDLRAALDWYPEFAEAYNMLAMARVEGGGPNSAFDAIRAAMRLSPRNQQYVFNLGVTYAAARKWDAARAVFERLKAGSDPAIASAAAAQLAELGSAQKYGIPLQKSTGFPSTQSAGEGKSGAATGAAGATAAANGSPGGTTGAAKSEPAVTAPKEEPAAKAATPEETAPTGPIQFAKGKLVSVDCSHPPEANVTVVAGAKTLKLHTADYKSLTVIGADSFSCEWANRLVSINYRLSGKTTGVLVSVEVQ